MKHKPSIRHAPGGEAAGRALLVPGVAVSLLALVGGCGESVTQPIEFSHKAHAAQGISCTDCHKYPETQPHSGLPTIDDCMECHEEPQGKSPEEQKVREAAKAGRPLAWKRLFTVPDHVYYSHRRHVVLGKIKCPTCHGNIGRSERPPTSPPVQITMDFCMDCHVKRAVMNDCVTCHR